MTIAALRIFDAVSDNGERELPTESLNKTGDSICKSNNSDRPSRGIQANYEATLAQPRQGEGKITSLGASLQIVTFLYKQIVKWSRLTFVASPPSHHWI